MNYYKFINSKDIRTYLEKIEYKFTSLEAAWLIWQSQCSSLEEKHIAWNELIATMPDCEIHKRSNTEPHPSLHGFLRELILLQKRQIQLLYTCEPNAVYSYSVFIHEYSDWSDGDGELFSSFEMCFEKALVICKEYYKSNSHSDLKCYLEKCRIRINKILLDNAGYHAEVEFNGLGDTISIRNYINLSTHEDNLVYYGFDGMWFAFPTPFKKGDILKGCNYYDEFFVFLEMDTDCEVREQLQRNGDCADMIARGYFQDTDNGNIYYECMHNYMNLEYYRDNITGVRRILKALSSYLKGEIDIDLYSNAYRTIIEEEHTKALYPLGITESGLLLAGLK